MIQLLTIEEKVRGRTGKAEGGRAAVQEAPNRSVLQLEARARARRLEVLVGELAGAGATAALRLEILRQLDQFGPRLVRQLPRAWPITRDHVRGMVRSLVDAELVAFVDGNAHGAARPVRITEGGTRVLEEIDWDETVRLADEEFAARAEEIR